jgi:hypothetical protein
MEMVQGLKPILFHAFAPRLKSCPATKRKACYRAQLDKQGQNLGGRLVLYRRRVRGASWVPARVRARSKTLKSIARVSLPVLVF